MNELTYAHSVLHTFKASTGESAPIRPRPVIMAWPFLCSSPDFTVRSMPDGEIFRVNRGRLVDGSDLFGEYPVYNYLRL
jgi:hypothetical protein